MRKITHEDLVNFFQYVWEYTHWIHSLDYYSREIKPTLAPELKEKYCAEDYIAHRLLNGGFITFYVEDEENEGKSVRKDITLKDIRKGVSAYLKDYPAKREDVKSGYGDFWCFDGLLQYCVFGDWIYG